MMSSAIAIRTASTRILRDAAADGLPGPHARRFSAVIEDATGRQVIGNMSGNQQNPDIMCEVFILSGTDPVDDEIPNGGRSNRRLTPRCWDG